MILNTYIKQPSDELDYDVIYDDWMVGTDTLDSAYSTVTVDKAGLTVNAEVSDTVIKVWARGGIAKTTYKITVTAQTADGRVKQDEFIVKIKDY